jgi:hypothetical protein
MNTRKSPKKYLGRIIMKKKFEVSLQVRRMTRRLVSLLVALSFASAVAFAQTGVTLKNSFIGKYKNRATIDLSFIVDLAHKQPNKVGKGGQDGDMHIAGRSKDVGLPMVAEIVNAKDESAAVQFIHSIEGNDKPTALSGVWRLWCEHPSKTYQVQGAVVSKPKNTNPDHVFEVHPVTKVGTIDVLGSLKVIDKYTAYTAERAVSMFEKKPCQIIPNASKKTTTINTKKVGFNYVRFVMELSEQEQEPVADGRFVTANILDSKGEPIAEDIRMVFVKDTEAEKKVKTLEEGDTLEVLAIPRINLEEVSNRVKQAKSNPQVLKENLPYEMVVIGVY